MTSSPLRPSAGHRFFAPLGILKEPDFADANKAASLHWSLKGLNGFVGCGRTRSFTDGLMSGVLSRTTAKEGIGSTSRLITGERTLNGRE